MAKKPNKQSAAQGVPVDAFILFNEKEKFVEKIVDELGSYGISTFFWRRDIKIGERWQETEDAVIEDAKTVCVFLGEAGWGPNHLRITNLVQEMRKPVIPVLIGTPPKDALEQAHGLFSLHRYIDLESPDSGGIERLAAEIKRMGVEAPDADRVESETGDQVADPLESTLPWIDRVVDILRDGDEEKRSNVLDEIKKQAKENRLALAARLRDEIRSGSDQRPGTEQAVAPDEDPEKSASIRSWLLSALICTGAEDDDSEELLLSHLRESFEPYPHVRFWVLAGLYQNGSRILPAAAEATSRDSRLEIRELSFAVKGTDISSVSERLLVLLLSEDFAARWSALRVLRIVPIIELVPYVCDILQRAEPGLGVAYDALYALSNPLLAPVAAERFDESPGLEETVRLVVAIASSANKNAIRNFAVLLIHFHEASLTEVLQRFLEDPSSRSTAENLISCVDALRGDEEENEIYIAGYASDFIDDKTQLDDSLGIEEDVKTLTAVMLAKDVQAPLAIGLFGDWGSGKSYFMQSMHASVEDLKANGSPELFRRDVCQIRFNAWHYVDTNLWASLVSTILERLAAHVSPEETPERKEAALIKELGTAQAIKEEAEAEKKGAQEQVTKKQNDLQELQRKREQKEIALTELRISDLALLFQEKPELKTELERSLKDLGVPAAVDSASDLSHVLVEANSLRSRATALALSIFQGKNVALIVGGLVLMLIVIPLYGPSIIGRITSSQWVIETSELLGKITVALGSVTLVLRTAVSKLKSGLERVEQAKLAIDKRIAEKRQNPSAEENELQNEIAGLKAREHEAISHLDAAAAKVVQLEEQIRAIEEGRSLARFLAERTNSEDYRKHLGLISTIRKDFDSLAKTLSQPAITEKGPRLAVDRIILYIDDLDRCPEDKVMDVLQAVHLLLAYPLFVVVVGVDPRWLLHSLGKTYSAFQVNNAETDGMWRTTPQNYLEKIFQIPFNLNRMTGPGYGKLLTTLMGAPTSKNGSSTESSELHEMGNGPGIPAVEGSSVSPSSDLQGAIDVTNGKEIPVTQANVSSDVENSPLQAAATQAATATVRTNGKKDHFVVRKEALMIQPWEREFAEQLYPLIPTPRAAKRFSNIYRILKARIRREDLGIFEGTKVAPGTFQIPMLLLAMLIGSPEVCAKLFPIIKEQSEHGVDVGMIFGSLITNNPDIATLHSRIRPIISRPVFPKTPQVYVDWVPRVARFSFDAGRAVQAGESGDSRAQPVAA